MPVPDEFVLAYDYGRCEICERGNIPDPDFVHVVVDNEKTGEENEKRWYSICSECRERCRNEPTFEKYVTEKVFKLRLGRVMRCKK